MKRRKILIISLIVIMILSSISFAYAEKGSKNSGVDKGKVEIKDKSGIKVTKKIIKYDNSNMKVDMEIPVIEGLTDLRFQKQINNVIEQDMLKLKADFEKKAKEQVEKNKRLGITPVKMEFSVGFEVKNENGVLSIVLKTYTYIGSPKEQKINYYYNIDIDKNSVIQLSDLFEKGTDYKQIINKEIEKQIAERKKKDEIFWEKNNKFKTIAEDNHFYIEDGNLVIVFPQYSIGPTKTGIPEFKIPLYKLNRCLKNPISTVEKNVYYNNKYNFQFEILPSWEEKIYVVEHHAIKDLELKVDFVYTPEDTNLDDCKLMSISVMNRKDYHRLTKSEKDKLGYKVSETKEYVYLVKKYNGEIPYVVGSKEYNEYKELEISINRIDDLFKITVSKEELKKHKKNIKNYKWVIVNGKKIRLDKDMYINKNGTLMIPVATVSKSLGYTIKWNSRSKTVTLDGKNTSSFIIGQDKYEYSKSSTYLAEKSVVIDGTTFVPVDYFEKVLKLNVSVNVDGTLTIESK